MSEPQRLENQNASEVSCLLIPILAKQLLVPAVTVAEMASYQEPMRDPDAPDWYLGDIIWREQTTPIVCCEAMAGESIPDYNKACRLAILNNTGVGDLPFMGIATQGIPRLARVKAEEIHQQDDVKLSPFELMAVHHAGESVIIPDVAALEQAFMEYRRGKKK